jgi:hypothetical protein
MTKLEKRQIKLLELYQKWGIFRFTLITGTLAGIIFSAIDLEPDALPLPWYYCILISFVGGYLLCFGLWFFAKWYLGNIKRKLYLQPEDKSQMK